MKKIYCPSCGKELIKLNPDDKRKHDFWCDDCDIDITVKENKKTKKGDRRNGEN